MNCLSIVHFLVHYTKKLNRTVFRAQILQLTAPKLRFCVEQKKLLLIIKLQSLCKNINTRLFNTYFKVIISQNCKLFLNVFYKMIHNANFSL